MDLNSNSNSADTEEIFVDLNVNDLDDIANIEFDDADRLVKNVDVEYEDVRHRLNAEADVDLRTAPRTDARKRSRAETDSVSSKSTSRSSKASSKLRSKSSSVNSLRLLTTTTGGALKKGWDFLKPECTKKKPKSTDPTSSTKKEKKKVQKRKYKRFHSGGQSPNDTENEDEPQVQDQEENEPDVETLGNIIKVQDTIDKCTSASKKSKVWLYFHRPENGQAKCRLCVNKSFKTGGGTSNLRSHLQRSHPNEYKVVAGENHGPESGGNFLESQAMQKETITSTVKMSLKKNFEKLFPTPYQQNSAKCEQIDRKLMMMIARDYQPFSIVEDGGFIDFVRELNPRYKIISRKSLSSKLLPQLFGVAVRELRDMLKKADHIALTCDAWTSSNRDSYLGITCHFIEKNPEGFSIVSAALDTVNIKKDETANSLKIILNSVMKEWEIREKVVCLVTDNAAVMLKVAELLNIPHLPCFAHSLNLVIKNAVLCRKKKKIQRLIRNYFWLKKTKMNH